MPNLKALVRELAQHALAKKGAEQAPRACLLDVLEEPHVHVPGASWNEFLEVRPPPSPEVLDFWKRAYPQESASGYKWFAYFPVYPHRLEEHKKRYPMIFETDAMERDGAVGMAVPLDAGVPVEFLKALTDEAYAIAWNRIDANARLMIELYGVSYDEPKLMDRLIETHRLKEHRKAIHKIARHAVLLRTKKSSEAKIPLGATKIGGRPDLPVDAEWPAYNDGKPLAFLAQINLAEIAALGTPIKGLPRQGLLSVFSVWGWTTEEEADPQTPALVYANARYEWRQKGEQGNPPTRGEGWQEQVGWTAILHTPPGATLERRKTPRGVNAFKTAAVESTPTLSLPRHRLEPPLAALGWTDDEYQRFDRMQSDYHSLQMGHWLRNSDAEASHHLLGGYAIFQQEFPEEVLGKGLAMLLQIGSDGNTHMCWGDGGELTFYADAKALARGRFERIYAIYQCG